MPRNIIRSGGNGKISLLERPLLITDPDAINYINLVEQADNQTLELQTKIAINNFVKGCKNDGIWDAIKSSCILAGARTLNGVLVPLKGIAPSNFGFNTTYYNRNNGLIGDGSAYLNANRSQTSDPFNDRHIYVYITQPPSVKASYNIMGSIWLGGGFNFSSISYNTFNDQIVLVNNDSSLFGTFPTNILNFTGSVGTSRDVNNSVTYIAGTNKSVYNIGTAATNIVNFDNLVFGRANNVSNYFRGRIAFYSIGTNIDLTKLDLRVSALMTYYSTLT